MGYCGLGILAWFWSRCPAGFRYCCRGHLLSLNFTAGPFLHLLRPVVSSPSLLLSAARGEEFSKKTPGQRKNPEGAGEPFRILVI